MAFDFEYIREDAWPPLAWVAECTPSGVTIRVRHGSQVEARAGWFCEAVWDGSFADGDFDRTDLIFGSGARLRGEHAVFVSAGATVDRLQFFSRHGKTFVSNSLACLVAVSGAQPSRTFDRFNALFRSIQHGIDAYQRRLPTEDGQLELVYFRNIAWDGNHLRIIDKPAPHRDFSSFEKYHGFLRATLHQVAENLHCKTRNHRYGMIGALSSGYDSTTTAVLGREAGMTQVFSFRTARGGVEDHGKAVADSLGLTMTLVDRLGWRAQSFSELPYFAASGEGEDVVFASAAALLEGNVLLTGFHGDKVWGKNTESLGADIVRGDISGLSFTEHRLMLGCIHLPVPFIGVRQIADVHVLSNSDEMRPWDVPGDYSRPIARRIAEEAGVPRASFGVRKKAATSLFHRGEAKLSENTRDEYFAWLQTNIDRWKADGGEVPRIPTRPLLLLQNYFYLISRFMRVIGRFTPPKVSHWLTQQDTRTQRSLNVRINMPQHIFAWAVEVLSRQYHRASRAGLDAHRRTLSGDHPDDSRLRSATKIS